MAVELILLEDVKDLGRIGDQVRVANGFARNFLLPRKLGIAVTKGNMRRLEARKLGLQQEHEERVAVAQALAEKIASTSVTITAEAGEEDKLYGSVTPQQVAEAMAEQGVTIDRHSVVLEEPIRQLGVYEVDVNLHSEVQAKVKVWVVRA
ncbi:MAG: 50S ribosomal protein L9 [Victivallales bacterium]|jgi:large subunit ribosomal protein L9|nr:50S ribosomal protein L9 [Victivallales bacterium]MBT7165832.1 50S ribosomal protein L9 [Victivallales bacterium]MBT7299606.1 50S ribosomal protein L9 [Victivallales bacterium]